MERGELRAQALMQQAQWQYNAYHLRLGQAGFARLHQSHHALVCQLTISMPETLDVILREPGARDLAELLALDLRSKGVAVDGSTVQMSELIDALTLQTWIARHAAAPAR